MAPGNRGTRRSKLPASYQADVLKVRLSGSAKISHPPHTYQGRKVVHVSATQGVDHVKECDPPPKDTAMTEARPFLITDPVPRLMPTCNPIG